MSATPNGALEAKVVQYIATEAARRYGPLEPRLAEKLQRNIRRTSTSSGSWPR